MATLNAAAGHASFVYQFRRSIPGKGESDLGSFHSLELPYVFGALHHPVWSWLTFREAGRGSGRRHPKLLDQLRQDRRSEWRRSSAVAPVHPPPIDTWSSATMAAPTPGKVGGQPSAAWIFPKLKQRLLDNQ
jgi:hypothetical protein